MNNHLLQEVLKRLDVLVDLKYVEISSLRYRQDLPLLTYRQLELELLDKDKEGDKDKENKD